MHRPPKSAPATSSTGTDPDGVDMSLSLQQQLERARKTDSVADKLRQAAAQSAQLEKTRM
jgi:hypothetical protein